MRAQQAFRAKCEPDAPVLSLESAGREDIVKVDGKATLAESESDAFGGVKLRSFFSFVYLRSVLLRVCGRYDEHRISGVPYDRLGYAAEDPAAQSRAAMGG